jgi:hypothetical protein
MEHWDNGRTCGLHHHATTCASAFVVLVEGEGPCVPFFDILTPVLSSRLSRRSPLFSRDTSFLANLAHPRSKTIRSTKARKSVLRFEDAPVKSNQTFSGFQLCESLDERSLLVVLSFNYRSE